MVYARRQGIALRRSEGSGRRPLTEARSIMALAVAIFVLSMAPPSVEAAAIQEAGLRVVVLEGDDPVNVIEGGAAVPTLVEVRDGEDRPVSGAAVQFQVEEDGPATLNGGLQQVAVTTNALGVAEVTVNPLASGTAQLSVTVTFRGQTVTVGIVHTNFATAAEAEAAGVRAPTVIDPELGGDTGGAAGVGTPADMDPEAGGDAPPAAAGGGGGGGGGGLGSGALVGILGGVGAAVGVGVAVGGGGGGGGDDAAAAPPVRPPTRPSDPGGTRASATLVAVPSDTPGVLTAGDVDYFRISVSRSVRLEVYTSGSTDTYGSLESASGSTLARNDDGGTRQNFRIVRSVPGGTYYIRLRGFNSNTTGNYTLHVRSLDHGNSRGGATRVAVPSNTPGRLTSRDVDYFRINVSRSGRLEVYTSGSTDTYGSLESASGSTLARNDDGGTRQNFRIVRSVSRGTYYIRLRGFNSNTTGNYTLHVRGRGGLSSSSSSSAAALSVSDARVEEAVGAAVTFAVTLSGAPSDQVMVDYATQDGSARAGEDYTAARGTLTFEAGESWKTVEVEVTDDARDDGHETFVLALSNASGARLEDAEATGTIVNTTPPPAAAALLARFGRASAQHVVEHVEERMARPREPGFRARFAGRDVQPGMERDFALGLLSQFDQPAGTNPMGAFPMSSHTSGMGIGAPGTTRQDLRQGGRAALPGYGASSGRGTDFLGSVLPGGDLLTGSEFELNREQHGGVISVWSRGARSHFGGRQGTLSLNGDVRTTMFGADYTRGRLVAGLSVARSQGLGGYDGQHVVGHVESSVTGLHPWLGYRVNDRVTVWGVTGYGAGALRLTPDQGTALETGLSMAMAAAGTRGELVGSRASGGFALAFKADALWVGTSVDGVDSVAGRMSASEAAVTRVRTGVEASRGFTIGSRMSLTPSVEVGLRQDGGDAETGTGVDVGGGLAFTDSATGLSLDVRMRTLVVHQADGFTDRGMSLSFGWNPTPSSPLGFAARVAPSWGGQAQGSEALWSGGPLSQFEAYGGQASAGRVDAELGYGVPVGRRFVGTPRVGFGSSAYGRNYQLGYSLGALGVESMDFELGVDVHRRERPLLNGSDLGVLGRASVRW